MAGRRDEVVLAATFHQQMGTDPNTQGGSRRWIVRAVEDSLRRLGTDRIDLYQMHRPSTDCDIDETLAAISDLVHAGKVLCLGSSTFPAAEMVEAQWAAERRGRERFVCEQPPYSMLNRGIERDVLPTCERYGMGVITWSPLGAGWPADGVEVARPSPVAACRAFPRATTSRDRRTNASSRPPTR